jgi:two-component system OmpR family sensor kinase
VNTRSITFRLASWCAGISLLVCLGFGIYTYAGLGYYLQRAQADTLQRRARQIAAIVAAHIGREGETFTIDLVKTSYAPERNDRFIRIRRPDGSTLYVSGTPSDRSFNPAQLAALTLARGRQGQPGIVTLGNLLLLQTEAQVGHGRYVIDCGASKLPSGQVLRGFLVTLGCGLPFIFVVAVTGGAMLVRHALVPVRRIIDGAKAITLYNVGQRLPVAQTNDELEHLSIVLNEMIERLHQAFQHSQRFLADASHELRTPLTIMRVELEGMSRDAGIPAALSWRIASVLEETERLASIVEGLFAISRLETGEGMINVTRVNLCKLVVTTADQMMLLADEKGIGVRCDTGEPVEVSGDNFRLKQVVVNLLDNAIKYTQPGGEVCLRVHAAEQEAILDIADRGPGMPPEALPHVFDRFFRADTVRTHSENGAGLGLAIVRSICLAHGGSVEAANRPGGGCRLTVRLPLAGITAWPATPALAAPPRPAALVASA